ncbi:uncharacterized protein LOC104897448 [Beta vulgaris subsp. vulgaris]|uniref:uncharacterized protein LOC104897448 n=1 Tax=Beta vulgaris subsp. vulgaris TaxID=3555 RepID=UPI00053F71AF|nr:uncharacterized protein LOC104897448 [Beta vulgaris subsp. vulgaris]
MEKLLDMVNCPTNLRVKLASFYLDGQADMWWMTVKNIAQRPDFTWDKFLEKLWERFYPPALQTKKECEFLTLRQGKMSMVEYTAKFVELSQFAPDLVKSEKFKVTRYFEGLNFTYINFQELYDRALEQERISEKEKEISKRRNVGSEEEEKSKKLRVVQPVVRAPNFQQHTQPKNRRCFQLCGRMYAMGTEGEAQPEFVGNDNLDANGNEEAELIKDEGNVISRTFLVNYVPAYVLFYSGASNSFIPPSLFVD